MLFHFSSFTKKGATMVELMIVLAIMSLGIAGMAGTVVWGIYFASSTEKNIKAIGIAREGLEWVINIRDTNWLRFSSDKTNCWKVDKYNGNCIGGVLPSNIGDGTYSLYSQNGTWFLSGVSNINHVTNWSTYANAYRVGLDANGFPTQTGVTTTIPCSTSLITLCLTPFTRQIVITSNGTDELRVDSIVRWQQSSSVGGGWSGGIRNVTIGTVLTNWKSKF